MKKKIVRVAVMLLLTPVALVFYIVHAMGCLLKAMGFFMIGDITYAKRAIKNMCRYE